MWARNGLKTLKFSIINSHKNYMGTYTIIKMAKLCNYDDNADYIKLGEAKKEKKQEKADKRRYKKTKKVNEKELLNEVLSPINENFATTIMPYSQYLSSTEKQKFEDKFTKPKNASQIEYVRHLQTPTKKIIIASGPAGTGKTLFATEYGVKNFLGGGVEKLVFTRPSVSVDEDLGFLPGTLEEKMAPWIRPIYDILYQHITPKEVQALLEEKVIEIAPLGFMRGRTFKNCWIVADEMQNSSTAQMKMLLTRLGENSRLIITGDLDQTDRSHEQNGLADFLEKFRGRRSSSISSFEFANADIQREEVVREILDIYSASTLPKYEE